MVAGSKQKKKKLDNLDIVRCEASKYFRNKKNKYLKVRIGDLKTNSQIKTIIDFTGTYVILRRVTNLELIRSRGEW